MTIGSRQILRRCLVVLVIAITFAGPISVRADCPLYENLKRAEKTATDTANALSGITIPPELEKKIIRLALVAGGMGMNLKQAYDLVSDQLTFVEKTQMAAWLAAKVARDKADAAYQIAKNAYAKEMADKDTALTAAEKTFKQEQDWLEEQKKAIKAMPQPRDADAYLDHVSQITERLKKAYLKMKQDLAKYTECYPDARSFIDDKDDRLKRITALDAEIARRRGLKPADPAAVGGPINVLNPSGLPLPLGSPLPPVKDDPAAPGPLGDTYVCDGPEISPRKGKLTAVDATGFTFEIDDNDKKASAGVKVTKAPPAKVRINERVELVMTASGQGPAWAAATWQTNNVIAGQLPCDNDCSNMSNYKRTGDSSTATVRFFFGAGENPAIGITGGQYNSPDGTDVVITWKYHKAGGP